MRESLPTARARSLDWVMCLVFASLLLAPGVATFVEPDNFLARREMRSSVKWSSVTAAWDHAGEDPRGVTDALRGYVADHFGLRNPLLEAYSTVLVDGLGATSTDKVLLGRDGWAFLRFDDALASYLSIEPYSEAELDALAGAFASRQRWLAKRGVAYLVTCAPNKHSVYPEHLPSGVARVGERTRLDQLAERLAEEKVPFVDLRPALAAAKLEREVYDRLGTHWNEWGAYVAYAAIVEAASALVPEVRSRPLSSYEVVTRAGGDASLAFMLGRDGATSTIALEPRFEPTAIDPMSGRLFDRVAKPLWYGNFASRNSELKGPRITLLRDSFGTQLLAYFAETFPYVDFAWPRRIEFPASVRDRIARNPPDLVIQLFVERMLQRDVADVVGEPMR